MKNLPLISLLFVICLFLSAPAAAQIYKYQTADGQVVYTNDYAQIPAEYRDQITGYEEETTKPNQPAIQVEGELTKESIAAKRQEFAVTNQELNQTFQSLTERQQALEAQRDSIPLDNDEAWSDFNGQLAELNLEIDTYKKRSEAFVREVEDFNKQIEEYNKKALERDFF